MNQFCEKRKGKAENQIVAENPVLNTIMIEFMCGRFFYVLVHDTEIGMSRIYQPYEAIPATIEG